MKKIVKIFISIILISGSYLLSSCDKGKVKEVLWDSGPIENIAHGGEYIGKVRVYTIDWIDYTKERSEDQYRVYKKSNGEYIIDYDGRNYILQEAENPFEEGFPTLRWKFDYNHYIDDIPAGW